MILIVSNKEDYTADYFISKIENSNENFFRFNTEDFLINYEFIYIDSIDKSKWKLKNKTNSKIICSNNITGVWYRRPKIPNLNNTKPTDKIEFSLMLEAKNIYYDFLRTINANWISHPDALMRAENKLMQLKIAKSVGFSVPESILTNSICDAEIFAQKHETICVKPLRNGSYSDNKNHYIIYNQVLSKEDFSLLSLVPNFPTLLQVYIEKEYEIRVIVVNDKVFSVLIDSQANDRTKIDWRVDNCHNVNYSICELPKKIEKKCLKLVAKFDLAFASMDLIFSKKKEYYFLDLNPNGQWGWLDSELNLNISNYLLKYLKGANYNGRK